MAEIGGSQKPGPDAGAAAGDQKGSVSLPTLSLPKGGGALRGIDEKFTTNGATGSAGLTVSINSSPSRSGFHPQLSLTYDSGSGNGPFGLGWSLSLPSITRKTSKGLPRYDDSNESDIFVLSGSEDLVSLYRTDSSGNVLTDESGHGVVDEIQRDGFVVRRYAPRIEGGFARIEKWTNLGDGMVHWRTITGENVTTLYGADSNSRIADSASGNVFSWLLCQSFDDKGNAMKYTYKSEDSENVNIQQANELHRTEQIRSVNRYIKNIKYGNRHPNRDADWNLISPAALPEADWMFEIVFDYGEHDAVDPKPSDTGTWDCRQDAFSVCRSRFEIRTYRLCKRVLVFHHFPEELGRDDYLVQSLDIGYDENRVASLATSFTHCGYVVPPTSSPSGSYIRRTLAPFTLEYSRCPSPEDLAKLPLQDFSSEDLENIPAGVSGERINWTDLNGEGLPGVLFQNDGSWYYKRNTSANNLDPASGSVIPKPRLGALEELLTIPGLSSHDVLRMEDLSSSGQLDAVLLSGPAKGFWKRTVSRDWHDFQYFASVPSSAELSDDKNMRLIDLTGDGIADILVTDSEGLTWYPGLGEGGYGPSQYVRHVLDEEKGPKLVFSDADQSIYLADMTGDGLTDLVRIRNSEVCYWHNLGYGRFGPKICVDSVPAFDHDDRFQPRSVHLADIDGTGTTDIVYAGADGIDIYANQSGNSFANRVRLEAQAPEVADSSVSVVDILGNGTACLVLSSSLPHNTYRSLQYVDLMQGQKPYLLTRAVNNMGSETRIRYAPSTRYYLDDLDKGRQCQSILHFPIQCVERVEVYDWVRRTRFTSRYAFHDGYYDGVEREFHGFGMMEQWDTEELDITPGDPTSLDLETTPINLDAASYIPPIYTKTWLHTGAPPGDESVLPTRSSEYYHASASAELDVSVMAFDKSLGSEEFRQAYRALKGSALRSEVYSLDPNLPLSDVPRLISEKNYTVNLIQAQLGNPFAVFFTHARETLTYDCEDTPDDGRLQHELTLETDRFGNVLKALSISYGRRPGKSQLSTAEHRAVQERTHVVLMESDVTKLIDEPDQYRLPVLCQTSTWEVTGVHSDPNLERMPLNMFTDKDFALLSGLTEVPYDGTNSPTTQQKRLVEQTRTLFRSDDLTRLLPFGQAGALGITGETYRLAFTSDYLSKCFQRGTETLIPDLSLLQARDKGAYVDLEQNGKWWKPSEREYMHPDPASSPAQELSEARAHFFLIRRDTDQFGNSDTVDYDQYDLLPLVTRDALQNTLTARHDYRILKPHHLTDENGNRSVVAYDALGLVAGNAIMGKTSQNIGDNLEGFDADLTQEQLDQFFASPTGPVARALLANASTRTVYDPLRYWRAATSAQPPTVPAATYAATITREFRASDSSNSGLILVSFGYSDGIGQVIQSKRQAEPGPLGDRDMVNPRWTASGYTVLNNKGMPVKKFEPFFDDAHDFRPETKVGVCSIIMYDSQSRAVATLHPNHTWEKVVFDAWDTTTFDVSDTVDVSDPRNDPDVGAYFKRLSTAQFLPSWVDARKNGQLGPDEKAAATKAREHANTPSVEHFDSLGRNFLKIADNGSRGKYMTYIILDVEGNRRQTVDARGRIVSKVEYDMLGGALHHSGLDNGERWILNDATDKAMMAWDSRGYCHVSKYDALQRLTEALVRHSNGPEILVSKTVYGEGLSDPTTNNHRGRIYQTHDQAGIVTNEAFDFEGNITSTKRQLWSVYQSSVNISEPPLLESGAYTSTFKYDALKRPIASSAPDGSLLRQRYNEAGFVDSVDARAVMPSGELANDFSAFIQNIDYDAQGQKTRVVYGNGTVESFSYDPLTYRLAAKRLQNGNTIHLDLRYVYDPLGNVSSIRDAAQQTIYFRNAIVDASVEYTYDALSRLISATGREHLGQTNGQPNGASPPGPSNEAQTRLLAPGDGNAMGRYLESYTHDETGNILNIQHSGSSSQNPGWTQRFTYQERSLLENGKTSNRLSSTNTGNSSQSYEYDAHGNMTKMPHLTMMQWDFKDQLQATSKQFVNNGTSETTFYVYDNAGNRIRKVTERAASDGEMPSRMKERIYIGEFWETYREYPAPSAEGDTAGSRPLQPELERVTLHVPDDQQPVCCVETRVHGTDPAPAQLTRYSYGNHLGSVALELNDAAEIISYEEYFPYGGTSFQSVRSQNDVPKRYR
ncbi:SpvB domain-containing protein, partial [Dactylonectria macrodidyma]